MKHFVPTVIILFVVCTGIINVVQHKTNNSSDMMYPMMPYHIGDTLLPDYVHSDTLVVVDETIANDDSLWEHCDYTDGGIADILYKACHRLDRTNPFHDGDVIWPDDDYIFACADTMIVKDGHTLSLMCNWYDDQPRSVTDSIKVPFIQRCRALLIKKP